MWMRLFQIVLFVLGMAPMAMLLSLSSEQNRAVTAGLCLGSGFVTAAFGTWIYLRIKHGKNAPTLRNLIVDTLHKIS